MPRSWSQALIWLHSVALAHTSLFFSIEDEFSELHQLCDCQRPPHMICAGGVLGPGTGWSWPTQRSTAHLSSGSLKITMVSCQGRHYSFSWTLNTSRELRGGAFVAFKCFQNRECALPPTPGTWSLFFLRTGMWNKNQLKARQTCWPSSLYLGDLKCI